MRHRKCGLHHHGKALIFSISLLLLSALGICSLATAQEDVFTRTLVTEETPALPGKPMAHDTPYDAGASITVSWKLSADDGAGKNNITGYDVLRSTAIDGDYALVSSVGTGTAFYVDTSAEDHVEYYYKVRARAGEAFADSPPASPVHSSQQWYNAHRSNLLVISAILSFFIILFIMRAKKGKKLFIRRIAGLEAVDEAVGRATEMGKSILYVPGIQDLDDVQTVAGITILGALAKTIAKYDTKLDVPVSRSMVLAAARETVKQSYLAAGRPDAYNDDIVHYITDEQFGYVAALDGIMVRDRPAACFYLGSFFAESLILAETGSSIGAIQVAGTAQPAQLPFFVAACDYTLIGEELFAASAYLSKEPRALGSLKGADAGKVLALTFIGLGVLFETLRVLTGSSAVTKASDFIIRLFSLRF
ncbi:DUF6754 domain-containing protein [Candidatus Zixiibacteriota bacterium]